MRDESETHGSILVPDRLARGVVGIRGEEGREWLRRLPDLVASLEDRWELEVGAPFADLWYTWVALVRRSDGAAAVLKLCVPGDKEFAYAAQALRIFDGRGVVRLLALDLDLGAMLLERVEPGKPLSETPNDADATSAAASVIGKLWRPLPPDHPFPTVSDWAQGFMRLRRSFDGGTGPMPAAMVEEAESLFADLLSTQEQPVLLHGDLHHENILSTSGAGRDPWLAIDPKGVAGEPAYEVGALLRNPARSLKEPRPGKVLERRIHQLEDDLGLDRERVQGWGFAQAVLAAYWSLEDSGEVWDQALSFAKLLRGVEN